MTDRQSESDQRPSGIDWGVVLVVGVFLAIPIAIWQLLADGSDGATREQPERPAAESPSPAGGSDAPERSRRRARRGEIDRLEREFEAARTALDRARIERAQSPSGTWDEIVEERQRAVAELRQKLEEARGR